ncbi:MAG TPA: hypothetical protein VK627_03805 [Edaphobacter sp.]|nr:hypothetical protein [Edaphobacter sp.]
MSKKPHIRPDDSRLPAKNKFEKFGALPPAKKRLSAVHVYHAFHHDFTTQKPRIKRKTPAKTPIHHAKKLVQKTYRSPHFSFDRSTLNSPFG